jgi:hypothetical protein
MRAGTGLLEKQKLPGPPRIPSRSVFLFISCLVMKMGSELSRADGYRDCGGGMMPLEFLERALRGLSGFPAFWTRGASR